MMVAIVETTSESKHGGTGLCGGDAEHNCGELRSLPLNPGAAALSRAGRGTGFRGVDEERKCIEHRSLPLNPGAAALSRAGRGTVFRGADAEHICGELRSLPLNINGANTYQFVMSNPVGNVDPWGLAGGVIGKGVPATAPGSAPGSGSVTATGKSGPIPTGIPGTTVSVGATGTASTGGNYTGSVTGTAKVNTGGGSSVSVGVTATGSGKITKNPKSPNGGVQVKCQVTPLPGITASGSYNNIGSSTPPYWTGGITIGPSNDNFGLSYSSQNGGTGWGTWKFHF